MKKVIFIIGGIGIVGLAVFIFVQSQQKAVISTTLSARAKAYLEAKSGGKTLNEAPSSHALGGLQTVDTCFSFDMPYTVTHANHDGNCLYTYGITNPRGNVIIYEHDGGLHLLDQIDGIQFRRSHPEQYKEEKQQINGQDVSVFADNSEGGYFKTAFMLAPKGYVVLTIKAYTGESQDEKLSHILQSIKFL